MNTVRIILLAVMCGVSAQLFAYKHSTHQQLGLFAGYNYLNAPEWNKMISAYNFARPYLQNKMPSLTHGFTIGAYYSMPVHLGINLNPEFLVSRYRASADNFGEKFTIGSMQYSLVANVRMYVFNLKKHHGHHVKDNIFVDLAPSFTLFSTTVRQGDDRALLSSGEEFKSNVLSVDMRVGLGYDIHISNTLTFTPNIRFNWYPKLEIKNMNEAVTGSDVPDLSNKSQLFNLQIGANIGHNF